MFWSMSSNDLSGSAHNVVQAGTINGGVIIGPDSVSQWAVYLQAADALSSSVPLKEYAALLTLTHLVQTNRDMHSPVSELVLLFWTTSGHQAESRHADRVSRLAFASPGYLEVDPAGWGVLALASTDGARHRAVIDRVRTRLGL